MPHSNGLAGGPRAIGFAGYTAAEPEQQAFGVASALATRGHEVHVFAPVPACRSYYQQLNGLHHHMIGLDSRCASRWTDLAEASPYYLRSTEGVAGPFDVLHGHHRAFLPVLAEGKSNSRAKAFLTLYSEAGIPVLSSVRGGARLHPLDAVERIVVPSHAVKSRIVERLRIPEDKVDITYPGVALQRYSRWVDQGKVKMRCGFGPTDPIVLCVGEMSRATAPDVLLEAMFELVRTFPPAKLIFVGDGPMLPYLRDRAGVLGMLPSTRFFGFVSDEDLVELYNACDIVCLPFRAGRADQTVLEAWCAGKPTIVSRAAAPDFLEPGVDGIVTKPEVASVAQAIATCLADMRACLEMGRRAWHRVDQEFSWEAVASKTLQVYNQ
ncbi:MAG: glycosyltransferase family 4 protein [Chloroflexi bacterium]|nr:glycosyltransferase family 4 protein [Chloroflexota bacterium]